MSHICLRSRGDAAALFCGDTLFNAGRQLPQWRPSQRALQHLRRQLAKLPDTTLVYPGHDYISNNLRFTLDREPDNAKAKAMLPTMETQDTTRRWSPRWRWRRRSTLFSG